MKLLSIILLICSLLLIPAGCAYYNTFYNAEVAFKEAQSYSLKDDERPTANAIQQYNQAIKKCGVILTEYKDSKYADDALFLLAKCLYFKQTNYIQAIETINDLLKFYPESEFVPEAHLYLARSNYEYNDKPKALQILKDFLKEDKFNKYHPQALQLLADYYLQQNDIVQSQSYLSRIIDNYPKSKEYQEAYLSLGKSYHLEEDYQRSNEILFELLESRIAKKIKLDSRYYIALNYIYLEEYETALKYINRLLKDEYRLDNLPKIQLLKARALVGTGDIQEAIELFELLIENNNRTKISAEASYHLAEIYFLILQDYEMAIENYNKVQQEFSNSEFVEKAITRSSVASQIIQYYRPDSSMPTSELVEQQLKLAEYYLDELNYPDSALAVYNNIINRRSSLETKLDSLNLIYTQTTLADSLSDPDSLSITDSLVIIDSLLTSDSALQDSVAVSDSTIFYSAEEIAVQIERIEQDIIDYQSEYIPLAHFIKIWMYKNVLLNPEKAEMQFKLLKSIAPGNKYTNAAESLLAGEEIRLISHEQEYQEHQYKEALNYLESDTLRALDMLHEIYLDQDHAFNPKAAYVLGFTYYFEFQDTLQAKPYLNYLLESDDDLLKNSVSRFYEIDTGFKKLETLPALENLLVRNQSDQISDEEPESIIAEEITQDQEIDPAKDQILLELLEIGADEIIYPASDFDVPPIIISYTPPVLPDSLKGSDYSLKFNINVLPNGEPGRVILINPAYADPLRLQDIAREAIMQWEFSPALKQDQPVNSNIILPVKFKDE